MVKTFAWPAQNTGATIGILAAITSPDDPIGSPGLSVAAIVPTSRHILLKEMSVETSSSGSSIVGKVIFALGLAAVTAFAAYELLNKKS